MAQETLRAFHATFYHPGSFFPETSTFQLGHADCELAAAEARSMRRVPYGFTLHARERGPLDLDSRETWRSGMYYIGGTVQSLEELEAKNDPTLRILVENMRCNGWAHVIRARYGNYQPFTENDHLLPE